jgi:hypothetical protein
MDLQQQQLDKRLSSSVPTAPSRPITTADPVRPTIAPGAVLTNAQVHHHRYHQQKDVDMIDLTEDETMHPHDANGHYADRALITAAQPQPPPSVLPGTSPYCTVLAVLSDPGTTTSSGNQQPQTVLQHHPNDVMYKVPLVASTTGRQPSQNDMCDGWVRNHPFCVTHLDPKLSNKSDRTSDAADERAEEDTEDCTADLLWGLCPNAQMMPTALLRLVIRWGAQDFCAHS